MDAKVTPTTHSPGEQMPARGVNERIRRLWRRAWERDFGPFSDLRAKWARELLEEAKCESCAAGRRAVPRKLQIARLQEAVCGRMPIHIAPDELIVGKRTVFGWPEIEEAIARGAAEPGYMIADYPAVLSNGLLGIIKRCERRLGQLDEANPRQADNFYTLQSIIVSCRAAIHLAKRHADECRRLAALEQDEQRKAELEELARICSKVPAYPAETLHEAIQSLWLTHLAIYLECDSVAFSLGRLDQYLYPFYLADVQAGRIDRQRALELIECLWIKLYENVRGEIGHVQTVTVGGVTPDGQDGVNEMTWIIQQATRELGAVGPSVATRFHRGMSDDLLRYVLETMRMGNYMPQIYNDEQMVPAIASYGVPLHDAREYGLIGCHEPTICGKGYFRSASWPGYFCFQDCLELALGNGCKLDTGERLGPATGCPSSWKSFDDLWQAFCLQMSHMVREKVIAANRGEVVKRQMMPRPMMSALIEGCIDKGLDFTEGGALYNFSGFQAFGLATCADSLAAIRKLCFDSGELSIQELVSILKENWNGHEALRMRVRTSFPHYGNDIDEVDELAVSMVRELQAQIDKHTNIRGGPFILGLWSFWQHVHHGKQVAASPDGRRHGEMMSHSMGPSAGCALAGPTAAIRSAAKIDTSRLANGGSLLLEFHSSILKSEQGIQAVISLIRTYFQLGGIQLQLSTVTPEMLEAAVKDPDSYRHLVVRVAGYCDFFVRQDPERQAFIIAREKFGSH